MPSVVAIVLAAGRGVRLGARRPKAEVEVAGRSLLAWSLDALARAPSVDAVLPVVGSEGSPTLEPLLRAGAAPFEGAELLAPVEGGEERQDSVERGIAAAQRACPDLEWVLVHDAARCGIRSEDAESVLRAAYETGAAIPVVPVSDTIKELEGGRVVRTPDRAALGAAQTPQAFRASTLACALAKARQDGFSGTDCASLVERIGVPVVACAGFAHGFKVTTADDLARMRALLEARWGGGTGS